MLGKIIRHPIATTTAVLALGSAVVGAGGDMIDKIPFVGQSETAQAAPAKSCFDKEQKLTDKEKQGITICFEKDLENISFEYYSIADNGVKSTGLADEEKFKEFINLQTFDEDMTKAKEDKKDGIIDKLLDSTPLKDVKGISEKLDNTEFESYKSQKIKEEINLDLENQ